MRILRAKYKVRDKWLWNDSLKSTSPIWRAIESSKSLVVKGTCYLVGDGASINVWTNPWVPWIQGFIPKPKSPKAANCPITVSMLINHDLHCWKPSIITQYFDPPSVQAILSIPILVSHKEDKLCGVLDSKGVFFVKTAYRALPHPATNLPSYDVNWKKLWKLKAPQRIIMFLWRLGCNVLLIRDNLSRCLAISETCCVLCNRETKTALHLFFNCPFAKAL